MSSPTCESPHFGQVSFCSVAEPRESLPMQAGTGNSTGQVGILLCWMASAGKKGT
jgi:hypothetical protein